MSAFRPLQRADRSAFVSPADSSTGSPPPPPPFVHYENSPMERNDHQTTDNNHVKYMTPSNCLLPPPGTHRPVPRPPSVNPQAFLAIFSSVNTQYQHQMTQLMSVLYSQHDKANEIDETTDRNSIETLSPSDKLVEFDATTNFDETIDLDEATEPNDEIVEIKEEKKKPVVERWDQWQGTRTMECKVCLVEVSNRPYGGPREHVLEKHIFKPFYECGICGCGNSHSRVRVRQHMTRVHGGVVMNKVWSNREQLRPEIELWLKICFATVDLRRGSNKTTTRRAEGADKLDKGQISNACHPDVFVKEVEEMDENEEGIPPIKRAKLQGEKEDGNIVQGEIFNKPERNHCQVTTKSGEPDRRSQQQLEDDLLAAAVDWSHDSSNLFDDDDKDRKYGAASDDDEEEPEISERRFMCQQCKRLIPESQLMSHAMAKHADPAVDISDEDAVFILCFPRQVHLRRRAETSKTTKSPEAVAVEPVPHVLIELAKVPAPAPITTTESSKPTGVKIPAPEKVGVNEEEVIEEPTTSSSLSSTNRELKRTIIIFKPKNGRPSATPPPEKSRAPRIAQTTPTGRIKAHPKRRICCKLCREVFVEGRMEHIYQHLDQKLFECSICKFTHKSVPGRVMNHISMHYTAKSPNDRLTIEINAFFIDRRQEFFREIEEMKKKVLGNDFYED